jgi:hypothetical protein
MSESTPEQQMALLNYMGMGMYGSPLMESAASQLNLVQDIGATTFDTVFMYNAGLITPEQLLDSIKNATREPVGDASQYDWESTYKQFLASGETELIDGANAIQNGTQTAAQYIRGLRSRMAEEGAYEVNPGLDSIIDSLEKQLEDFEGKYNNFNFIKSKVDSGEYDFDEATGMVYKPLLGEDARKNLRAEGWKGPFSEPEFWRTIPDAGIMKQAAKLQEQFEPIFAAYESDNEIAESRTRAEIAKTSPAMKRFIQEKEKKGEDVSGQMVQTTKGWKAIEDAYNKAMADFKARNKPKPSTEQRTYTATAKYVQPGTPNRYGVPGKGGVQIQYDLVKSPQARENDYWAQQTAYWTAKTMGAERDKRAEEAKAAEAKVVAKEQQAMEMGKTPALEWLKMMPQLAAMAAQPAPEKPKYVKPKPRVLSDQEIETMANMIAGGMG